MIHHNPTDDDLQAEMVLVSDVHLQTLEDQRGQQFMKFLDLVERGSVGRFVLLGDILDFCLGSSSFYKTKFSLLGEKLKKISQSGTEVIFLEGNHEFDLEKIHWPQIHIPREKELILSMKNGDKILLTHGDLIYSTRRYRWFRWFIKSRFILFIVSKIPAPLMDRIANKSAKVSRASDVYRKLDHQSILANAAQWLNNHHCRFLIFGHFHVPYAESVGTNQRLLSMDSWDNPNFLVYQNSQFLRGSWSKKEGRLNLRGV